MINRYFNLLKTKIIMNYSKKYKTLTIFSIAFVILTAKNLLFCFQLNASSESTIKDKIFNENIKTVLAYKKGDSLSYPVIQLNSREKIIISFDDLSIDMIDYRYKIYHYNSNWEQSDLFFNDYAKGFEENPFDDYSYSMNTFVKYTHYKLELPNQDIQILLPGNYAIVVYEDNEEEPIFIKRFYVVSNKVTITSEIIKPSISLYSDSHQELRIDIDLNNIKVDNPRGDIQLSIYQNGFHGHSIEGILPEYFSGSGLHFEDEKKLLFPGKREYLNFDLKNLEYLSKEIAIISYQSPYYHIYLKPDKLHKFDPYFYNQDLNGGFLIKNDKGFEDETEADYVYVNFNLPMEYPIMEGNIYINGDLSIGSNPDDFKLEYNFEDKAYEKQLFLKQGYYDYEYLIIGPKGDKLLDTEYQDNYFETENDYLIFVYQRDNSLQYDKIIGYQVINSIED